MEKKVVNIAQAMGLKQRLLATHRVADNLVANVVTQSQEVNNALYAFLKKVGELFPDDTREKQLALLIDDAVAITAKLTEIVGCCKSTALQLGTLEGLPGWDNVIEATREVTARTEALLQAGKPVDIDALWD